MRNASLKLLALAVLLSCLWCSACVPHLMPVAGGSYTDPQGHFELTLPHDGWQLLPWEDVNLVLWDPSTGASIVVYVPPLKGDADLANLTRHLLIAFERKRIISEDTVQIQGREAVKTELEGWVDGTEINAEVYVVQGDGVSYDILFWAPHNIFPGTVEIFHQFLLGITFLSPKGTR
jgi:hypothetical protein